MPKPKKKNSAVILKKLISRFVTYVTATCGEELRITIKSTL
jgi:hypothetical protein